MYKELYIQSKIIILITLNQINFCTQQNATHFLTGNLTQQFKVYVYTHYTLSEDSRYNTSYY